MDRRLFISTLAASSFAVSANSADIGDDGLHKQDWFLDSFLEMPSDLSEAASDGKNLLVLFEQRGCPYCRELHEVNFARKEITDFIKEHYLVVQLDMFGAREVLDFDGEALEERDIAGKWAVNFTPTTLIFAADNVAAKSVAEAEAFRLPGYLKPFHYLSSLEYVANGIYKQKTFQRYLQDKFAALEAKGLKPDVW
jgi:thioredoxin-related protein